MSRQPVAGSSISLGIPVATELLEGARTAHPRRHRYVVYLGDGEQTVAEAPEPFAPLQSLIDDALVLGYGTQAGGRMRVRPDAKHHVYDKNYKDAISRIDEPNLTAFAHQLGGTYQHRGAPGPVQFKPRRSGPVTLTGTTPTGNELAWLPGLGLLGLLGWELWGRVGAYRTTRKELA